MSGSGVGLHASYPNTASGSQLAGQWKARLIATGDNNDDDGATFSGTVQAFAICTSTTP